MMILCFVLKLKKVELTADLVFLALSACPNLINQILSDVCAHICVLHCLFVNIYTPILRYLHGHFS